MLGFELGGGALAGLVVVTVAVVIVAWLILRIVGRDHLVRVARVGVFVERQRVGEREDTWTADPLSRVPSEVVRDTYPLPPPTPPPPLPPRPPDPEDPTEAWPTREESP